MNARRTAPLLAAIAAVLLAAPAARAEFGESFGEPGWAPPISHSYPTNLPPEEPGREVDPEGRAMIAVNVLNDGARPTAGPITVTDTLPPGVTATDAGDFIFSHFPASSSPPLGHSLWECTIAPGTEQNSVVTCQNGPAIAAVGAGGGYPTVGTEVTSGVPIPNFEPTIGIPVHVAEVGHGAQEGTFPNHVTIEGGGAPPASSATPITISATPVTYPSFRPAGWDAWFSNANGEIDTGAGTTPYVATFNLDFPTYLFREEAELEPAGEVRNVVSEFPPGLIGNPNAVATCSRPRFAAESCPDDSQVGMLVPEFSTGVEPQPTRLFNLDPPPGVAALLGATVEADTVTFSAGVRTDHGYSIVTHIQNVGQLGLDGSVLTLWGVPADPSHDLWRSQRGKGGCSRAEIEASQGDPLASCFSLPEGTPLKPFLRMPTSCLGPQPFPLAVESWDGVQASDEFTYHDAEENPVGFTACNQLPFDPTISSKPSTNVADSPTGLEFDLHIPQPEAVKAVEEEVEGEMRVVGADPAPHEADVKNSVVTLPKGIAVNPSSANGLGTCTEAQIGFEGIAEGEQRYTPDPANCPDASKVGTVEVDTPLLREHNEADEATSERPLPGAVYVAKPTENPFGSLLAIYITVNDPKTGVVVKLAGEVKPDPATGQLTATVASPQVPFEDFHLNFFGGAHAALRTPQTCGRYETTTDFTPWSTPEGADAHPGDSFQVTQAPGGGACATTEGALPNAPGFTAGTLQPKAGAYSPFVLHLARQDGSQEISAIDTTLPEGLLGKLAGISECSDAQIAVAAARTGLGQGTEEIEHPSCPASSEVGIVHVGAGSGPDPYYVTGHAYLAGPYKGAPLSLAVITPSVAGPYDLGAVAVRTALYVNAETAQIHAVSDELPHILQGIPLDVRAIDLQMSRPNFTLNPTSCAKKTILGSATSVLNQSASLSSPFQVGECSVLGFRPKLSINLKGDTKRAGNPALRATVTYPSKGAYSNIAKASVALPHSEFLDQAHIKTICTRVQFAEGNVPGEKCPPGSIYGHARAITPLLDNPVEGPVYLRSSSNPLPDLVAALNGQIQVVLDGTIDSVNGGIRNRFEVVPDAPVSKFTLTMQGGKKGLLVNSTNLCRATNKATAKFTAQNGRTYDARPVVTNSCAKAKKHKKAHKGRKGKH